MVDMLALAKRLYPICRSLTGNGNRLTLQILSETVSSLKAYEIPSGTDVFDWTIPREWNCSDGYLLAPDGSKVVDFKDSNLHVLGYSVPVDEYLTLEELQEHLYSLPEQPDWVPYVTSYYKDRWGFCLKDKDRKALKHGMYHAVIKSTLEDGSLTYGEAFLPGNSEDEIFFSTYICHPSMANNELSGPCVAAALYEYLASLPERRYSYRFAFVPETIGSISYLSRNVDHLQKFVKAGFNLTCVGDDRAYSYLPSRYGNTLADRAALNILHTEHPDFISYSFLQRGSDERQYCSPGVDLPVCSVMRSKYGVYPEYHTSADNFDVVTASGLEGAFTVYKDIIDLLERNYYYTIQCKGEPQLGKRGLYPTISFKGSAGYVRNMINFLTYADGKNDLIGISEIINVSVKELYPVIEKLLACNLIKSC